MGHGQKRLKMKPGGWQSTKNCPFWKNTAEKMGLSRMAAERTGGGIPLENELLARGGPVGGQETSKRRILRQRDSFLNGQLLF